MEKQISIRPLRAPIRGRKINVGARIDSELYARFKVRCLRNGQNMGEVLTALIMDYLNRDIGREDSSRRTAGQGAVEILPDGLILESLDR